MSLVVVLRQERKPPIEFDPVNITPAPVAPGPRSGFGVQPRRAELPVLVMFTFTLFCLNPSLPMKSIGQKSIHWIARTLRANGASRLNGWSG